MKINLPSPRALGVIGTIVLIVGLGVGRARVKVTRVQGSAGSQHGEDFLMLNTLWWLVVLGGGIIGVAFTRHRAGRSSVDSAKNWQYVPMAMVGATGTAWLVRALTAIDLGTGWVDGRPVRSADGTAVLPTVHCEQAPLAAQCWIESARHEFSSIASFLETADALEDLDAPADLIERCRNAAEDERKHTDVCLGIAKQLGATDISIRDDVDGLRAESGAGVALADMAHGALFDGVIGEGFAAARLRRSAQRRTTLSSELSRLALDEQRHADLGADIVGWCLTVDPSLRARLADSVAQIVDAPSPDSLLADLSDDDRESAGLCTSTDAKLAWADARDDAAATLGLSRAA